MNRFAAKLVVLMTLALPSKAALAASSQGVVAAVPEVTALEPELEALYRDLQEHPELGFHEERTVNASWSPHFDRLSRAKLSC